MIPSLPALLAAAALAPPAQQESAARAIAIVDVTVVDVRGGFLIPGPWDIHVHALAAPPFARLLVANGVTGVRDLFTQVRELGADFVKVYSKLSRESYLAIAAEARAQGMPFDGHVPDTVPAGEAAAAGQRCIEHLTGVRAACSSAEERGAALDLGRMERTRLGLDTYDAGKANALCEVFVEHGTWRCPTLTVLRSISRLDDPQLAQDERLAFLPEFWRHSWNPAEFLGRTDELGSVAEGRLADLVLLADDPLQDIAHTRAIRAVVANGLLFEQDDLRALRGD